MLFLSRRRVTQVHTAARYVTAVALCCSNKPALTTVKDVVLFSNVVFALYHVIKSVAHVPK